MSAFDRPVTHYASSPVHAVGAETALEEVEATLRARMVSSLAVVDRQGRALGVVSRSDLLRVAKAVADTTRTDTALQLPAACADDVMTRSVRAVPPTATVRDAAAKMVEHRVHRLYVLDGERPVAVLSTKDLMRAVFDERLETPLGQVMSHPVVSVDTDTTLEVAVAQLESARIHGVVVLERGLPVGYFTQAEALLARHHGRGVAVDDVMSHSLVCLPVQTPLFRAAGFTISTQARRVLVVDHHHVKGILSGLDFARAAAQSGPGAGPAAATGG